MNNIVEDKNIKVESNKEICCVEGCKNKKRYKDGRCTKHHYEIKEGKRCSSEGCECAHYAKGLCMKHYNKEVYKKRKLQKPTEEMIENLSEKYPKKTTLKSYIKEKILGVVSGVANIFKSKHTR